MFSMFKQNSKENLNQPVEKKPKRNIQLELTLQRSFYSADNPNNIIREILKHEAKQELPKNTARYLTVLYPHPEKLIGKGKTYELKNDNSVIRQTLFETLRGLFTDSYGYWTSYPEYDNLHFRSFVNDLGKIDVNRIGQIPQIEDRIIHELLFTHLTLYGTESSPKISAVVEYFFSVPYVDTSGDYQKIKIQINECYKRIIQNLTLQKCHALKSTYEAMVVISDKIHDKEVWGLGDISDEVILAKRDFSTLNKSVALRVTDSFKELPPDVVILNEKEQSILSKIQEVLSQNGLDLNSKKFNNTAQLDSKRSYSVDVTKSYSFSNLNKKLLESIQKNNIAAYSQLLLSPCDYEIHHTCYTKPFIEYLFFEKNDFFLKLIEDTLNCSPEFQEAFIEKLKNTGIRVIADFISKETGDKIKQGIKSLEEYGTRLKEKKVLERGDCAVNLSMVLQKNLKKFVIPDEIASKESSSKIKLECLAAKLNFAKDLHSKDHEFVAHRGYKCIIANIASLLFTAGIPNLVKKYRTGSWFLFDKTITQELISDLDQQTNIHFKMK